MNTVFPYVISGSALWTWRSQAIADAQSHQIDVAEVDWLLQQVCQLESLAIRLGTLAHQSEVPSAVPLAELRTLWQRRIRDRVPVQHLVGKTQWRNFTLHVSPAVLIPRPETELIVELAAAIVAQSPQAEQLTQGIWVDLGTGSGAIALGLAEAFPQAEILAVDISVAALEMAQRNAKENGLSDRIQFLNGSWFEPLSHLRGQLTGIVSNPPYIPNAIIPTLSPEVSQHEPLLALDGGEDGLTAVQHLIQEAPQYLRPDGLWITELMANQASKVMTLLAETHQYVAIQSERDLAGIERFVVARKRNIELKKMSLKQTADGRIKRPC
ncbi:peptide chain release factor N(5)-glutamine methyltransferase [Oscillatoria sp. CS-180]|uniref:peptide chain release factor N(5)-glutamine methyltransferase n=1 Tax=Oscillatoria sp. CS-180 TaxID=3021720 RepID=UPI00232E81F4|nr:peptide chain release factor N(5)-glutamine methyltransferase [Oscillatoria sp. CS-180]MDB9526455.1 peptide chain release factor N(5)-glutamine methyltransferase [Oscillatoria sp. CS-180]